MARPRKIKLPAVPFGRPSLPVKPRITRDIVPVFRLSYGQVIIEGLRLCRRSAACADRQDADHANMIALRKRQNVTRPNNRRGFCRQVAVDAKAAGTHDLGCLRPCLEETRLPKPLVDPQFGRRRRHYLSPLSPMSAAAKGLSGSICFSFFGGLAEKSCGLAPALPPFGPPFR